MHKLKGSSFEGGRKFQLILTFHNGDALHTPADVVLHITTSEGKSWNSLSPRVPMLKWVHTCSQIEPAGIACAESAAEQGYAWDWTDCGKVIELIHFSCIFEGNSVRVRVTEMDTLSACLEASGRFASLAPSRSFQHKHYKEVKNMGQKEQSMLTHMPTWGRPFQTVQLFVCQA